MGARKKKTAENLGRGNDTRYHGQGGRPDFDETAEAYNSSKKKHGGEFK